MPARITTATDQIRTSMAKIATFVRSPLKRLREFIFAPANPLESRRCVICQAGHPDLQRLARIVGKLKVGENVNLAKVRDGLDANFKTVIADLEYLVLEMRLPIEFSRRGILLKEPVALCENCAWIAELTGDRHSKASAMRRASPSTAGRSDFDPVSPPLNLH